MDREKLTQKLIRLNNNGAPVRERLKADIEVIAAQNAGIDYANDILESATVSLFEQQLQKDIYKLIYYGEMTDLELEEMIKFIESPVGKKWAAQKKEICEHEVAARHKLAELAGKYVQEKITKKMLVTMHKAVKVAAPKLTAEQVEAITGSVIFAEAYSKNMPAEEKVNRMTVARQLSCPRSKNG